VAHAGVLVGDIKPHPKPGHNPASPFPASFAYLECSRGGSFEAEFASLGSDGKDGLKRGTRGKLTASLTNQIHQIVYVRWLVLLA